MLNAPCLNATGPPPETNANAKKQTRPLEHNVSRIAAEMQRHIIITERNPVKDVGVHGSTVAFAMLVLDPERHPCYHVVKASALREWLTAIPGLHKVTEMWRTFLALHSAHVVGCCHRRKGEI